MKGQNDDTGPPPAKRSRHHDNEEEVDVKPTINKAEGEPDRALVKLVERRRRDVQELEDSINSFKAQLVEARKKLADAEDLLEQVRNRPELKHGKNVQATLSNKPLVKVKQEQDPQNLTNCNGNYSESGAIGKPLLVIPGHKISPPRPSNKSMSKMSVVASGSKMIVQTDVGKSQDKLQRERFQVEPQRVHAELIRDIRQNNQPHILTVQQAVYISSQHRRKLRSIILNPTSAQQCATSALDGIINLWEIQGKGHSLSLFNSVECSSLRRKWPEDLAWHPSGESIIAVYNADDGDTQVGILSGLIKRKMVFLEDRPHVKGLINNVEFMPWDNGLHFVTAGSDHAVVMWSLTDEMSWKPKALHRSLHTSSVSGVAGNQSKHCILSSGLDKRVVGFNTQYGKCEFQNLLDSKAMGILSNPVDLNLFMVQAGTPGMQLRLFDMRVPKTQLHSFGWKQESSESQSALINQSWSSDGFHIASGSADPKIHVFDIRFNSKNPAQSVDAHKKRVFQAAWHHCLPLLISISSDTNIGLHRITG
ncbi:hypothetical protein O6H91_12G036700 [Diphasiastrum complanatum]|uniref:Uncharacterized protein n=2 Tax=Diphasiastrum complanatum TaxID=34168 RepID=A0ACC2C0L3_DIPCM|nr:hypothetical protein O6H91_12G029300 [Diphasiastrum complanatum]KAJ7535512.1 hypothetical protein O6H91_12G036700 [Diphasiastrum complanatum]